MTPLPKRFDLTRRSDLVGKLAVPRRYNLRVPGGQAVPGPRKTHPDMFVDYETIQDAIAQAQRPVK